jgi:hypothetical protein
LGVTVEKAQASIECLEASEQEAPALVVRDVVAATDTNLIVAHSSMR